MGSEIKLKEIKGLNINGKLYECDPSDYGMMHGILYHFPEILAKLQQGQAIEGKLKELLAHGADTYQTEVESARDEVDAIFRDTIDSAIAFIKGTLGEDEYNELFGGKKQNMAVLVDLCAQIYEWANADRAEVVADYLLPNRTQRRAAKKAAPKKKAVKDAAAETAE